MGGKGKKDTERREGGRGGETISNLFDFDFWPAAALQSFTNSRFYHPSVFLSFLLFISYKYLFNC